MVVDMTMGNCGGVMRVLGCKAWWKWCMEGCGLAHSKQSWWLCLVSDGGE